MKGSDTASTVRVAIVDDEHLVRLGIRSYLDDSEGRYNVVGAYSEGRSALAALREEKAQGQIVDVLLTDIRMPVMDGIALAERCREESLVKHIVVLSCHDEFDLVRKAFTSGANEYVLKHEVEQNELLRVLDRVSGSEASRSHDPPTTLGETVSPADRESQTGDSWSSRIRTFDKGTPVIISAYRFCHQYDERSSVVPWKPDTVALDREIIEAIAKLGPAVHVPMERGGLIVFELRSPDEAAPERRVRKACESIMTRIRRYWNREMQFWIDPTAQNPATIDNNVRRDAVQMVWEYGFHFPGDSIILPQLDRALPETVPDLPRLPLGEPNLPAAWDEAVAAYLQQARAAAVPASHLYLSLSGALHQIDRDLTHTIGMTLHDVVACDTHPGRVELVPGQSLIQQLESIDSIDVLTQWLHDVFELVNDALIGASFRVSRVGRVLSYLDETYKQPLDLDALAERFSISKAYLCSRVRQETGITLSQHINQRRIARARELLRTTRMSAKEVCFAVGYDNPNYFSRVFRSVSGESITEFRNAVNQ